MLPYDAVTARSGASAFKDARKAGSDAFSGVSSLSGKSPRASASSDTGDGGAGSDRRELRLRRHSGCDTTAATSKPSAGPASNSDPSTAAANCDECGVGRDQIE